MAKQVGIREVAAAAGVSLTTVSHALNGKGRLPEETRQRVRAVASELGYATRSTGRSGRAATRGLLGLFISEAEGLPSALSGNNYFTELLGSASGAALEHGYALVLAPALGEGVEDSLIGQLDGAIVVDPVRGDPVMGELRSAGVPVVTTGKPIDGEPGHWVDNDVDEGARKMLAHLRKRGATRIGLIDCPEVKSASVDARRAYRAYCEEVGVEPAIAEASWDLSEHAGFDAALQLLEAPEPPDAIFATYDRLALGVLLAADANGLSVPRDLLVAGITDSVAARMSSPSLTVLTLNPTDVGERALEMLVRVIEGARMEAGAVVPTEIIPRGSTRRPAVRAAAARPPSVIA